MPSPDEIAQAHKPAVAAALNLIEDRRPEAQQRIEALLADLSQRRGAADGQRIGLTGPPGVGKSTLTAALSRSLRRRGLSVGVVAVDPSSIRSGGALLGDRARMSFDPSDEGLFVRSLATAGDAGGLAYAVPAAVEVLAAAYDRVVVETTGVGQSETDVQHVADTVVLVVQPGSGDTLQFIKAGIMEIPDIIVVNKGDLGKLAERAASDLVGAMDTLRGLGMADGATGADWRVPVLVTSARDRIGIEPLVDALQAHHEAFAGEPLRQRRLGGAAAWALELLVRRHGDHCLSTLGGRAAVAVEITKLFASGTGPLGTVRTLGERYLTSVRNT